MDFYSITQWIYPLLDLIVMVLCFTMLRGPGGIMLGIAFLIMSVSSLSWPIAEWLANSKPGGQGDFYFDYSSIVAFGAYLVSSLLIIAGVINIGTSMRAVSTSAQPMMPTNTNDPYQTPTANIEATELGNANQFGNILFYLIPYLIGIVVMSVGFVILLDSYSSEAGMLVILFGVVLVLGGSIYLLVIIYRIWAFVINESNLLGLTPAIRSPGQAVGFMFIPFFNFYWVFQVYGKMANNINAIARQRGATQLMPEGLGITIPILIILTIIPYIGSIISLVVGAVLVPIFISQAIRMSGSLYRFSQSN